MESNLQKAAPELLNFAEQFQNMVEVLFQVSETLEGQAKESYENIIAGLSLMSKNAIKNAKDD